MKSHAFMLLSLTAALSLIVHPAAAQTGIQLPPGIINWWTLDETSGTIANDIIGNHSGTHINGPVPTPGLVLGSLRFDGINDYVSVADSDLWAFGSDDFTIELWANFDAPGSGSIGNPGDVFIGNDEGPGYRRKWFFALGGGCLNFHINGPGIGPKFFPLVPFSPTVGVWYHLAVTREGNTYSIYIDGEFKLSAINSDVIPNANAPLTIGQAETLGYMNGRLDEISIYNRALTAGELKAIYDAGSEGKDKGTTLVELVTFLAVGQREKAGIYWKTASEIDTAGFHIWRCTSLGAEESKFIKITDHLIPSKGGPLWGAEYTFFDYDIASGQSYFYRLEDISCSGLSTLHNPVSIRWMDE